MVYFGGMTMHYLFDAKTGKTHKLLRSKSATVQVLCSKLNVRFFSATNLVS